MLYLHLHIVTRTGVMSSGLSEGVRALGGGGLPGWKNDFQGGTLSSEINLNTARLLMSVSKHW